jgi:selenocysteine-specific elongation factor
LGNDDLYFTVSTAGHVDHGKTSVLKRLTGIDTDRLKEEKERQMTTDLGFAHMRLPAPQSFGEDRYFQVGFIDVPGHGKFLKNMIAGVGALDMALLVVAADEGPMPQTLQHLEILSLIGVTRVLLVVTKIDLVNEQKVQSTIASVSKLLADHNLEMLQVACVSCVADSGFAQLKEAIATCLSKIPSRTISTLKDMPIYLPIDRAFSIVGHGLVVTGTLVRGTVRQGDTVWIEPLGAKARIRGLETFGHAIERANPGQRLALNLAVKDHDKVRRGQSILGVSSSKTQTMFAVLQAFAGTKKGQKLEIEPQPLRLYHGTSEIAGHLRWCEEVSAISAQTQAPQAGLQKRAQLPFHCLAQIALEEPLIAEPDESFIVRFGDDELAGGTILLKSRPRWLGRKQLIEFANLLLNNHFENAVLWFAQHAPQKILKIEALDLFMPLQWREKILPSLIESDRMTQIGEFLISPNDLNDLQLQLQGKLSELEDSSSDYSGITLEKLRRSFSPPVERVIFDDVIDRLLQSNGIIKKGEKVLSARAKDKSKAQVNPLSVASVEKALANYVCIEVKELATACNLKESEVERAIKELEEQHKAKLIAHEFACSAQSIKRAHEILSQLWIEKQQITPSDFKERINITRKYAMAMLSYFDDTLVTRRVASGRVLLKKPTA